MPISEACSCSSLVEVQLRYTSSRVSGSPPPTSVPIPCKPRTFQRKRVNSNLLFCSFPSSSLPRRMGLPGFLSLGKGKEAAQLCLQSLEKLGGVCVAQLMPSPCSQFLPCFLPALPARPSSLPAASAGGKGCLAFGGFGSRAAQLKRKPAALQ